MIDPFEGIVSNDSDKVASSYNRDPDYVLRQYPKNAPIILHKERIPIRWTTPIAFLYSDTGNPEADAAALPIFYENLSPGGMILSEQYANNIQPYEPVLAKLNVEPLWLPSGQGVIVKN